MITIDQIRQFDDFKEGIQWEVNIPSLTSYVGQDFLPVESVEEKIGDTDVTPFEAAISDFKVITRVSGTSWIRVTFFELHRLPIEHWFEDWLKEIGKDKKILPIKNASRELIVKKYSRQHNLVKSSAYKVVPSMELSWQGVSKSTVEPLSFEFLVTAVLSKVWS